LDSGGLSPCRTFDWAFDLAGMVVLRLADCTRRGTVGQPDNVVSIHAELALTGAISVWDAVLRERLLGTLVDPLIKPRRIQQAACDLAVVIERVSRYVELIVPRRGRH
jgi:hypothetical protein